LRRRDRQLPSTKITRKRTSATVTEWLAFSPENPASIRNCLEIARANARSVRTALTGQMWDAINSAWHELHRYDPKRITREEFTRFLNFVKEASVRFDGTSFRTMLRNDAYWFSRLGFLVERADATARILDVKYHVLLPREAQVGGPLDYFQWASILRSVSALTSYHWVYRDSVKPWLVADLLILNRQMPRSLASCYENINRYLDDLAQPTDARARPSGSPAPPPAGSRTPENGRHLPVRPARIHHAIPDRQQSRRQRDRRSVSDLK
jgi:uncharacterized alpha-E superfamily protein